MPRAPLPPLGMLRAFEAAGRMGSMRKAAQNVGLSHTVVSRHIRNLETWLGTRLVTAGPGGVALTQDGRRLFDSVSQAFNLIAGTVGELRPASRKGTLRIWCMPGLATRWLTPRLSRIEEILPGVDIVLRASEAAPDFSRFEADLMIGFGDMNELPTDAVPLIHPRMFPVVSASWAAANALPRSYAELAAGSLIHEESRQQWLDWFEAAGFVPERPLTGPRLWNASLGLDAALAGQGIALATRLNAADEIASGRLIELFSTDIRLGGYYLLAPRARWANPLLSRFRAWIERNIVETEHEGRRSLSERA
jgi:LysR family transcriptional regulator, glycine cleavage system transcriptional activator